MIKKESKSSPKKRKLDGQNFKFNLQDFVDITSRVDEEDEI